MILRALMSTPGDKKTERPKASKAVRADYGVVCLTAKTDITSEQAMFLVDQFGSNFERMEFEAAKMTSMGLPEPNAGLAKS
jgi:hypothetical protein